LLSRYCNVAFPSLAHEVNIRQIFTLSFDDARAAVEAGLQYAKARGFNVTIAVVDAAGTPVLLARMDDASPPSAATAVEKAKSAATTGFATSVIEDMTQNRLSLLSLRRVAVEGGVPILYQAQKVGGVGVSGTLPAQDAEIAKAALEALTNSLR
jgi:glc operon protein GlcG